MAIRLHNGYISVGGCADRKEYSSCFYCGSVIYHYDFAREIHSIRPESRSIIKDNKVYLICKKCKEDVTYIRRKLVISGFTRENIINNADLINSMAANLKIRRLLKKKKYEKVSTS
jgi:hypothetical protein